MSRYLIQEQTLTAIANAVREKNGTTEPIKVSELPSEIANIQAGGGDSQWDGYWLKTATHFTLPNGTDRIQQYAFMNHENLESIAMPSSITFIGEYTFYNCKNLVLTELPRDMTGNIGASMFYGCEKLALTELPSGITGTIGSMAFRNCIGLKSLTFKSTPKSIAANVFQGCTNLITLNVPWAEGAVANAPWGAPNVATINYNYVGG